MNTSDKNSSDPVSRLEKQLLRSSDDQSRLKAYIQFLPDILAANPSEAIRLSSRASLLAFQLEDHNVQVEISRCLADAYLQLRDAPKALAELRSAYELVENRKELSDAAWIFTANAKAYKIMGDPVQALAWHEKALAACPSGATPARADVLEALADFYMWMGRYDEAIGLLRELLVIREELDDQAGIGRALCSIGTGYGWMNDLGTAYDYHQRSLEPFQEAGDFVNMARALANMSSIHQSRGEFNDAIETAWRAHAACEENNDWATSASLMITIAGMHRQQGEIDLALEYYVKAFAVLQKYPDDNLLLDLYQRVGEIHQTTNDLDAAKHVYTQALKIAEYIQELQPQMELQKALSEVYELQGHYREALGHYKQFATLQNRLAGDEQRRKIAEEQARHDIMKVERERDQARQLVHQLEEDKNLQQLELIQARIDLTEKSTRQEKTGLSTKNGRADEKAARSADDHGTSSQRPSSRIDLEWEKLRRQLEKLHPNFERTLFEHCSDLTPTEIKICMLTRLLGDDTARIADVLDNSLRTVQTQRLKIRKKLKLDGEINFVSYIQTL